MLDLMHFAVHSDEIDGEQINEKDFRLEG